MSHKRVIKLSAKVDPRRFNSNFHNKLMAVRFRNTSFYGRVKRFKRRRRKLGL